MAEHRYSVDSALPVEALWEFVREMDHWAPFLTGYQAHAKASDTESVWTLKGDVGVLSRTLTFRVLVTEWAGPERVTFALEGVNEPMRGEGAFLLEAVADGAPETPPSPSHSRDAAPGRLARLWARLVRALFRRARPPLPERADAGGTQAPRVARMTFQLRLEPGGPMAPMIDAMMKPAMEAAAEDLARRIVHHLESQGPRA